MSGLSNLKICMVVLSSYFGDARVRRYVDALLEKGARVDVLSVRFKTKNRLAKKGDLRIFEVPVIRGDRGLAGYAVEYGTGLLTFGACLLWLHMRTRYDVIHVHNMPDFLVFAALIPRLLGAKVILDIHDPMPEFFMSKYQASDDSAAVRAMRLQERLSVGMAHAVITASPRFKESLVRRGISDNKVTTVMNIPDKTLFDKSLYPRKDRAPGDTFVLLYPGTIAPRYGLAVAIRAVGMLKARIPNIRLVLVGRQVDYVAELRRLAAELGVSELVQIKSPVAVTEIPRLMSEADVGLYPGLPDPHMSIATPTKVLEYATMGLPIVASRLKVLEDIFTDSELLFVTPGEPREMADAIMRLFENPDLATQLVNSLNRGFGRAYSWDRERRKYFDLLYRISGNVRMGAAEKEPTSRMLV
jgi:glycosyltransferase involved in cell wall biosynthesis